MMKFLRLVATGFSSWITGVATTIVAMRDRLISSRSVEILQEPGGEFTVRAAGKGTASRAGSRPGSWRIRIADGKFVDPMPAGLAANLKSSRAELVLLPSNFLFRPIELPRRATEFLDGIVRAQIDRLTPWSAAEAAFGWAPPADIANDKIAVTVAATARALVIPLVEAITDLGAASIVVSTFLENPGAKAVPIKVFAQKVGGALDAYRVRRALVAVMATASVIAAAATVADAIVGDDLQARQIDVGRRMAQLRAAMRDGDAAKDSALAALERRKHETPASVIVLDALSQILPDHTYVTELRITGDKMQVVGVTHDAPSLIRLIEQSPHFTRATFFAPTTRLPSETGEHFHIEAQLEPVFRPRT